MTFRISRPNKAATSFGVFHNLDCKNEKVGFIELHLFAARFWVSWSRQK